MRQPTPPKSELEDAKPGGQEPEPLFLLRQIPMSQNETFRFGDFELAIRSGELRKAGVKIHLQGKPLHLLRSLLDRPGNVVTRDELMERLWSAGTFVDFESGLNTAANRLRTALGDSADNPIYVETLPRVGYRFIAPVTRLKSVVDTALPQGNGFLTQASPPTQDGTPEEIPVTAPSAGTAPRTAKIAALLLLVVIAIVSAVILFARLRLPASVDGSTFTRVTMQSGNITGAKFTHDGKRIIYSAAWGDDVSHVYETEGLGPAATDLGYGEAWLDSVSPKDSIALFKRSREGDFILSEAANIGAPLHELAERHVTADYGPNGTLCLVRHHYAGSSIEYPAGHEIYKTTASIDFVRVSPRGDRVALLSHPLPSDDAGDVMMVSEDGTSRVLSAGWGSVAGLSWNPSGDEVWFTAARSGTSRELLATDMWGKTRPIARTPGSLRIEDATNAAGVLLVRNTERLTVTLANLKSGTVGKVSRFDRTRPVAISSDGSALLLDESGDGGGRRYSVYLYHPSADTFKRLGEGRAMDLSPDGRWALTQDVDDGSKLSLISTESANATIVSGQGLVYRWAMFLPATNEILASGSYPGKSPAIYRQSLNGGSPQLVRGLEDFTRPAIDPAGDFVVSYSHAALSRIELKTGQVQTLSPEKWVDPLAVMGPTRVLVRVPERGYLTLNVLDMTTGKLTPYRRVADPGATANMEPSAISSDLSVVAFGHLSVLGELFVVNGWR